MSSWRYMPACEITPWSMPTMYSTRRKSGPSASQGAIRRRGKGWSATASCIRWVLLGMTRPGRRRLPRGAVEFRAARAGGPGGQHVNTSATKVELRVRIDDLPYDEAEKARLRERLGGRIGADDALRVTASNERSQRQNRAQAERRLATLIG